MTTMEAITYVGLVVVGGGVLAAVAMVPLNILSSALENLISAIRFRREVREAIGYSQPTWKTVCELADLHKLSRPAAFNQIQVLHRDAVTGRDDKLAKNINVLNRYMEEYKSDAPFDALSNDTRILVQRIRENMSGSADSLHALAVHLKELSQHRDATNRKLQWATYISLIVGVVGSGIAVYQLL